MGRTVSAGENPLERRFQIPCRRSLCERRSSFLPLPHKHCRTGTRHAFVMEPETNGLRSLVHFLFFLVLLLFRLYPPVTSSFTGLARCGWRGWCIRAELPPPQTIQPSSRGFLKSTPSNQHLGLSRKEKAPASSAGLLLTQVTGRSHAMLGDWVGIWGAHDAT